MNTSQIMAMLNRQIGILHNKNERLKTLLYNAICLLEENDVDVFTELVMSRKEYEEIL